MHRLSIAALAFALLGSAAPARAEEAPPPAVPPAAAAPAPAAAAPAAPPAPKWYDTFEIHGLVDAYWAGNPAVAQSQGNALRVFDAPNGFQLSYAKLTTQLSPEPAGFRIDLGIGQTGSVLSGKPVGSTSIGDATVQQAYASFKLPADIVVDAGRFVTNAGAEVIEAKDNLLYSRSLLFNYTIPFTHLGARATIPIKSVEGLSLMAAVFNGWDNPPGPVGSTKAGHVAVIYNGPSSTVAVLNVIYGDVNNTLTDPRLLIDVVLGRAFGDLTLSLNGDFGTQKIGDQQQKYYGVALAGRYALLGDKLRIAARIEFFGDPDALSNPTGANLGANYYEGTLGLGIPVGKNAELRLEAREDGCGSDRKFFNGNNSQFVGQVAALAWF